MSDIAALVAGNIDIWTSATQRKSSAGRGGGGKRISLYGIERLRALIYDLAATGRLVSGEAVAPVKLGSHVDLVMGQAPPGNACNTNGDGTVFVKTGEFGPLYPEVCEWTTKPLKMAKSGDVLICVVGATIGKLNLAIDCAIGRSVAAIRPKKTLETTYLYYALMPFTLRLRGGARGSAQGVIGKAELNAVSVRIPPLAEQRRIVAKVDELMALCDALERESADAMAAHQTLVETLLGLLVASANPAELATNWARLESHFDTLFTTEASIEALKQTILDLAVRGKLVQQDAGDEAAMSLVSRIAKTRQNLVTARKAKRLKTEKAIAQSEFDFQIPDGWEWARLEHIALIGTGSTPSRDRQDYYAPAEINWVTSGETSQEFIEDTVEKISQKALAETNVSLCPPGTLIVAMYGQGKTRGQISELLVEAGTNQACATIQMVENAEHHRRYIKLFFQMAYAAIRKKSAGGAQPNLNVGKIAELPIPIPPLAEQHRIVAKVDALVALCDQLKTRITDAAQTQRHLADAITERAAA